MKTYHERTQDILKRMERYEQQKRRRRKHLYALLPAVVCLVLAVGIVFAFPSILRQPVLPPSPSADTSLSPTPSETEPPVTTAPPSSDPGTPHASFTQRSVSYEEAKEALGWELVPAPEGRYTEYVLMLLDGRPVGLFYRYENGSVRILSVTIGETDEWNYEKILYKSKIFLVPRNTTETIALYREGNLTYTASFMGVSREQAFEEILSLLMT